MKPPRSFSHKQLLIIWAAHAMIALGQYVQFFGRADTFVNLVCMGERNDVICVAVKDKKPLQATNVICKVKRLLFKRGA